MPRILSLKGQNFIRGEEGERLKSYKDRGGVWTIGIGETGPEIGPNTVWTAEQVNSSFQKRVKVFAAGVDAAIGDAPVSDDQFSALVSLAYNIGLHAFAGSTICRKVKAEDFTGALAEFPRWNKSAGSVDEILIKRRRRESELFEGKVV